MSDAPEALAERHEAPTKRGVAFLDLRAGQCRFPLGGFRDPPERFCGDRVAEPGKPYCPACMRRAYLPERKKR